MGWVISQANDYSNYFGEGGGDFQELGHCPLFGLLRSASELPWRWWVCYLAYVDVLQRAYNDAQGPLEIKSSIILDIVGSNYFFSCSIAMSFF